MRVWQFTEMPYPPAWDNDVESLRVTLPNSKYEPKLGNEIYNRHLDNLLLADQLGFDLMVNEHHATPMCLQASASVTLGILARQTSNARLLALGNPIANRPDPVRVAEEMSVIDNISGGRLEVGLIRGSPGELAAINSNPARMVERFWEAHDLVLKTWTSHDAPFNWEGQHYRHRQVNIWPRPYQDPHPPVWVTAASPSSAIRIADHGHVIATLMGGYASKATFEAYRNRVVELEGRPYPGADRFAYLALVAVGETDEAGVERARLMQCQLDHAVRTSPQFANPPGYASVELNVAAMKKGQKGGSVTAHHQVGSAAGGVLAARELPTVESVQQAIDRALIFAGSPESVYKQIAGFSTEMGGIGHLLMLGHAGYMTFDDHRHNIELFAREVLPGLRELPEPAPVSSNGQGADMRSVEEEVNDRQWRDGVP